MHVLGESRKGWWMLPACLCPQRCTAPHRTAQHSMARRGVAHVAVVRLVAEAAALLLGLSGEVAIQDGGDQHCALLNRAGLTGVCMLRQSRACGWGA